MDSLPYRIPINYGIDVQIVARSYCRKINSIFCIQKRVIWFFFLKLINDFYTIKPNIGSTNDIKTEEYCTVEGTVPTAVQEPISNRVQYRLLLYIT